jgi:hypothetical protein
MLNFYLAFIAVNKNVCLDLNKYFRYIIHKSIIENRSNLVFTDGTRSNRLNMTNTFIYISEIVEFSNNITINNFNNYLIVLQINLVDI